MEPMIFFSALSSSILTSLGQGLIIYIITIVLLRSAPNMNAERRFRFLYSAMMLVFAGFIVSLIRSYNAEAITGETIGPELSSIREFSAQSRNYPFYAHPSYTKWIATLYFTGILIQATIILAGFYQLAVLRRKSTLWSDKLWEERLNALCLKLNISRNVQLHLAERVFSPFTVGFIKPVIIFPIAMLNRLSPEQVEAILVHELAHIKRNDYLLNIFHKLAETILFFNPFMWLLSKGIRREREFACDDLVIKYTSDTTQYARALLHIAESKLKNCSIGIAASGDNKFSLLNRIKRLKNMENQQNNPKSRLLALLSVAVAFVSLACIIPSETTIPDIKKNQLVKTIKPRSIIYNAEPQLPALQPLKSLPKLRSALKTLPPLSADTDTNEIGKYFSSPEWKKQMQDMQMHVADMKKHFDSPEWKKQMQDMKLHFDSPEWKKQMQDLKLHFDSPEWKKQMKDMKLHFDSPEWKKQMQDMKLHFDSPEWRKQMQGIKINAEQMKTHALAMQKEFDSPEWKKAIEDMKAQAMEMKKQFDSPEWKKKIEEIKLNAEEMRKNVESPEWKKHVEEIKKMAHEMKIEAEKADKKAVPPAN